MEQKLVSLIIFAFNYVSINTLVRELPNNNNEDNLGKYFIFLQDVLSSRNSKISKECTLVLVSVSTLQIPKEFVSRISPRVFLEINLPKEESLLQTETPPQENATAAWVYPWPATNPNSIPTGNCAIYAVFFQEKLLEELLLHVSSLISIILQRDFFLLFDMDNKGMDFAENILLNITMTSGMKYKLLPVLKAQNGQMELQMACFFCNAGQAQMMNIGSYDPATKLKNFEDLLPDYTRNLNGTFLKVIYVIQGNSKYVNDIFNSQEPMHVSFYMITILSYILNFDYEMISSEVGNVGIFDRQTEDGTWVGFAGDVLYGKANVSLGGVIDPKLMKYIEYSSPIAITSFVFVTANAKSHFSPMVIFTAFNIQIWISIMILVTLSTIIFAHILKMEKQEIFLKELSTFDRYGYSFYYLSFSIFGWAATSLPTVQSGRIFVAFWLLFGIIINFFYQSELTSQMTAPISEILPTTYKEILDMGYKHGGDAAINAFFQYMLDSVEVDYLKQIRDDILNYDSLDQCFSDALTEKLACLSVPELLLGTLHSFLDDEYLLKHTLHSHDSIFTYGSSIFRKDFVATMSYNNAIKFLFEKGGYIEFNRIAIRRYFQKFRKLKRKLASGNNAPYKSKEMPLGMNHVKSSFILLGLGLSFAIIVFLYERTKQQKI